MASLLEPGAAPGSVLTSPPVAAPSRSTRVGAVDRAKVAKSGFVSSSEDGIGAIRAGIELAKWRRTWFDMYAAVRGAGHAEAEAALLEWRAGRDRLFANSPLTPVPPQLRGSFHGLSYYAYDPLVRTSAEVHPLEGDAPIAFDLRERGILTATPCARLAFELFGESWELILYALDGYGGGLWLPFVDASCGEQSFAGGRYLLDTIKGSDLGMEDERLVLDFNYAYNPLCSYSPLWTCPLAPTENRLDLEIHAGERMPPWVDACG